VIITNKYFTASSFARPSTVVAWLTYIEYPCLTETFIGLALISLATYILLIQVFIMTTPHEINVSQFPCMPTGFYRPTPISKRLKLRPSPGRLETFNAARIPLDFQCQEKTLAGIEKRLLSVIESHEKGWLVSSWPQSDHHITVIPLITSMEKRKRKTGEQVASFWARANPNQDRLSTTANPHPLIDGNLVNPLISLPSGSPYLKFAKAVEDEFRVFSCKPDSHIYLDMLT
jgi:hypothetical protein